MKKIALFCLAIAFTIGISGCASSRLKEFRAENGDVYRLFDTGVDVAGGQRIKIVDLIPADTEKASSYVRDGAASTGTFQDASGLSFSATLPALINGHYYAQGQKKRRPDNVNIQQSGGGAEATSGVAEGAVSVSNDSESSSISEGSTVGDVTSQSESAGGSVGDVSGGNAEVGPVTASSNAKGGEAKSFSEASPSVKLTNTSSTTNTITNRPSINNAVTVDPSRVEPYKPKHKQ